MLAGELRALGAGRVVQTRAGVVFHGSLELAYRVCLWSRLASRVLLKVAEGPAADADQLYATVQTVTWDDHLRVDDTLAVDFNGSNPLIRDARFGAMRVKDAIVDQFRARHGDRRPSVDTRRPDVRVNAHLAGGRLTVSVDLSGESLHRRGYRADKVQVEAPLKENLAAALLVYGEWPKTAAEGGSFTDPLCGSGTLPIEAAMMAADIAPGWLRAQGAAGESGAPVAGFGFERWRGHDETLWRLLVAEADERREAGLSRLKAAGPGLAILGRDRDPVALNLAGASVERAGLQGVVSLERGMLGDLVAPAVAGLLAANTPYGERLGGRAEAEGICRLLGERLRTGFNGWRAVVLTGSRELSDAVGLLAKRRATLYNGTLACTLELYDVEAGKARAAGRAGDHSTGFSTADHPAGHRAAVKAAERAAATRDSAPSPAQAPPAGAGPATASPPAAAPAQTRPAGLVSGGAEQFANRLHKNLRHLGRLMRREGVTCYRLYDADLPDYNFVVDVYGDWVHVQEYAPPAWIDPTKTRRRLEEALAVVAAELEVPPDHVVLKQRLRQRGAAQYERLGQSAKFFEVEEDDLTYLVNLSDYLDTGLFVDQRLTRRHLRHLAGGRRFLNLFAYTGTMTVNALAAGAPSSTTVDLSATYLDWAARNLAANGFSARLDEADAERPARRPAERGSGRPAGRQAGPKKRLAPESPHHLVRADCLQWIASAEGEYDLIWLDPPTFSNSKRMGRATFDVQRDHADLVRLTVRRLLTPGGVLLFSTNRRGFKLDRSELGALQVKDLSRATLPADCARAAGRHHVFQIEAPG